MLVIDAGHPRNAPAARMQGYLSRDGMPPAELLAAGRHEVSSYGGELLTATVTGLLAGDDGRFSVMVDTGKTVRVRRVLVTTGLVDQVPDVPGIAERWGKDLLHCPYCHGYEVRDRRLGVLGGTPHAVPHALLVRQWSADIAYFPHTTEPTPAERGQLSARGIAVVDGLVDQLVVRGDRLTGVLMSDGRVVGRDAVFVRPEFVANDALLTGLGCATGPDGWVVTDPTGTTSVSGVWASGNAVNPRAQVISAAGEGSAAAIAINADLVQDDVRVALQHLLPA